jgi:hypothetical protein
MSSTPRYTAFKKGYIYKFTDNKLDEFVTINQKGLSHYIPYSFSKKHFLKIRG